MFLGGLAIWSLRERWRGAGLTHSARRLETLDDVDLDRQRLIDAQHLVGVEIGLLDSRPSA
jgi:hypothetical protein